jgi:hypothetical protein
MLLWGTLAPDILSSARSARFSEGQALKKTSCFVRKSRRPHRSTPRLRANSSTAEKQLALNVLFKKYTLTLFWLRCTFATCYLKGANTVADMTPRGLGTTSGAMDGEARSPAAGAQQDAERRASPRRHVGDGVSTLQIAKVHAAKTELGCVALRVAAGAGFRFEALFGCVAAVVGAIGIGTVGHSRHDAVTELVATFDGVFVHGSALLTGRVTGRPGCSPIRG